MRTPKEKVILIAVEDLTSPAMREVRTPNLDILMRAGAFTLDAEPANPAPGVLPLWSILASRRSFEKGGLSGGGAPPPHMPCSIIHLAHTHKRSTAGYYSGTRFRKLIHNGPLDYLHTPTCEHIATYPNNMVIVCGNDINAFRPDFCFLHFGTFEHLGYRPAIMSPANLEHIEMSDRGLGLLLNALSLFGLFGEYHIVLTSDLGESHHEGEAIPWLASGPRFKRGWPIERRISALDTTPTIGKLMNLPHLPLWEGGVVDEIFLEACEKDEWKSVA